MNDFLKKARITLIARRLGWQAVAVAYRDGRASAVAKCQAPDWTIYNKDFATRRAAR